jgi:hypothetical protein
MSNELDDRIKAIKLLRQNGLTGPADDLELLNDVERECTLDEFEEESTYGAERREDFERESD